MDRTFEIAAAGLLHDVGKFAQRAGALREATEPSLYCPRERDTQRYTHHHAAVTAAFVEQHLPWLRPAGRGDQHVVGFAARHHRPASAAEWIVAVADRWASGLERGAEGARDTREGADYWRSQALAARLSPVLGKAWLRAPERSPATIRLEPLAVAHDRLFPEVVPDPDPSASEAGYRALWEGFAAEVARIPVQPEPTEDALRIFLPSFAAVYEKYAWCIPAATDEALADVSLFDHSRAVAMLAAALCRELGGTEAALESAGEVRIRDTQQSRLALLVGDLSGIQRFLYTIASRGAAQTLRGRSLALQLLADAIATRLLERLGLPPTNLIYTGGGKLWLLVHAGAEGAVRDFADEVDRFLLGRYGSALSFSVGAAPLRGEDLLAKRLANSWQAALDDAAASRARRLHRLARAEFAELFEPFGRGGERRPCSVCGAESGARRETEQPVCTICREQRELGRRLPGASWLLRAETAPGAETPGSAHLGFGAPLDVAYWLEGERPRAAPAGARIVRFALDRTEILERDCAATEARAWWFVGRNLPEVGGEPATYDALADQGTGAKRLGVLRMDVDNLGALFQEQANEGPAGASSAEGPGGALPPGLATLSRFAVLSRQISYFFSGHVGWLVSEPGARAAGKHWHESVQLVYSGGDDLLVVGHWSSLVELALAIHHDFQRFTQNPGLTLSGGLAVVGRSHPVAAGAERAGVLEQAAKSHRTPGGRSKDALALFDEVGTLSWKEVRVAERIVARIREAIEKQRASRSLVFRLQDVAASFRAGRATSAAPQSLQQLRAQAERGRWAWLARYAVPRCLRAGSREEWLLRPDAWLAGPDFEGHKGDRPTIEYLDVVARWAELLTRGGRS